MALIYHVEAWKANYSIDMLRVEPGECLGASPATATSSPDNSRHGAPPPSRRFFQQATAGIGRRQWTLTCNSRHWQATVDVGRQQWTLAGNSGRWQATVDVGRQQWTLTGNSGRAVVDDRRYKHPVHIIKEDSSSLVSL